MQHNKTKKVGKIVDTFLKLGSHINTVWRVYPVSVKFDCQILKKTNHRYCPLSRHC